MADLFVQLYACFAFAYFASVGNGLGGGGSAVESFQQAKDYFTETDNAAVDLYLNIGSLFIGGIGLLIAIPVIHFMGMYARFTAPTLLPISNKIQC